MQILLVTIYDFPKTILEFHRATLPNQVVKDILEYIKIKTNPKMQSTAIDIPSTTITFENPNYLSVKVPIIDNNGKVQIALALMPPGTYKYHVNFSRCLNDQKYKEAASLRCKEIEIFFNDEDDILSPADALYEAFNDNIDHKLIKDKISHKDPTTTYHTISPNNPTNNQPSPYKKPTKKTIPVATSNTPPTPPTPPNAPTNNINNPKYIPTIIYINKETNDIYIPMDFHSIYIYIHMYSKNNSIPFSIPVNINGEKYFKLEDKTILPEIIKQASTYNRPIFPITTVCTFEEILENNIETYKNVHYILPKTKFIINNINSKHPEYFFNTKFDISTLNEIEKLKSQLNSSNEKIIFEAYLNEINLLNLIAQYEKNQTKEDKKDFQKK